MPSDNSRLATVPFITVHLAHMGNLAGMNATAKEICDATDRVESLCHGKFICPVPANPLELCGYNPAPDQEEQLEIYYFCGKITEKYTYALAYQVATLDCTDTQPSLKD